ncbi:hypothetical protein AQPE_3186 [Aquipluma nitroreducens]|uniref:Uncharacterized protein n=1 Tax=Aquipluma nitroreducens TaxID=2010828 RepID=A0A5K7SBR2_9BACT|nr:hypothetical protein AQPE_3186 [Aquipluma nitroreducens]
MSRASSMALAAVNTSFMVDYSQPVYNPYCFCRTRFHAMGASNAFGRI